jgi:hypothetical protein
LAIGWIIVMFGYGVLANYGRRFLLPFGWLIASGLFFYCCHSKILAGLVPKACPVVDRYAHAVRMFVLGSAVPFVGPLTIDAEIEKFLFCGGVVADGCLPIQPDAFNG